MSQMEQVVFALMMTGMQKQCIPKCLRKTGDALSGSEKECLAGCQDKFMEGYQLAFQEAANRFTEDQQRASAT
jgi:hypothetical protein